MPHLNLKPNHKPNHKPVTDYFKALKKVQQPSPTNGQHGLPEIVRALKSFSARRINELRDTTGTPFWQRNYYEHIIRNARALNAIREYIQNNPINWLQDQLYKDASPNSFNQK